MNRRSLMKTIGMLPLIGLANSISGKEEEYQCKKPRSVYVWTEVRLLKKHVPDSKGNKKTIDMGNKLLCAEWIKNDIKDLKPNDIICVFEHDGTPQVDTDYDYEATPTAKYRRLFYDVMSEPYLVENDEGNTVMGVEVTLSKYYLKDMVIKYNKLKHKMSKISK